MRATTGRLGRGHRISLMVAAAVVTLLLGTASAWAKCLFPNFVSMADTKCRKNQSATSKDIEIGTINCPEAVADRNFIGADKVVTIRILKEGKLYIRDSSVKLEVERIEVDGTFEIGDADCPVGTKNVANQVLITFLGSRTCPATQASCVNDTNVDKGIVVRRGGSLKMFGTKGATAGGVSWTHLSEPAKKGDTVLHLAVDVTDSAGKGGWRQGDWIVLGTTSFSPFESEFVRIASAPTVNGKGGTDITVEQPLKYFHFGGPDPGVPSEQNRKAGAELNFGVDERAEVGLISRSIKLTAQVTDTGDSRHWGGEIKITDGYRALRIQGVEMEKFGKDSLGSYPIHFHKVSARLSEPLIDANSIHHSYNKCITIHSSKNMTISNNVCARIVGHIFYQEIGDEENITYDGNLGLGAMSHWFDINVPDGDQRKELIRNHWWAGDNLGQPESAKDVANPNYIGYNGLFVRNADKQSAPVHGRCTTPDPGLTGGLVLADVINSKDKTCPQGQYYYEAASGFWIINPGTKLIGNSIGGCQGTGKAFWYVPPSQVLDTDTFDPAKVQQLLDLKYKIPGQFLNNRAHSCYAGLFGENENGLESGQLNPRENGVSSGQPLIAKFTGFTATRHRFRGIWMRPTWFVVTEARLATNSESVTLVTAGGLDGISVGAWLTMEHSTLVGLSANNADRFGPCPYDNQLELGAGRSGGHFGCIDQTPLANLQSFRGGDIIDRGYAEPNRFQIGYMIYDGPVRLVNNRFVNFFVTYKPHLTTADQTFFQDYLDKHPGFVYEGDAALGWFNSNQSAYPVSTVGKGFTWENVELRHQIYTELVNVAPFKDGDKNTAIIDLDGSLTGYVLVDQNGQRTTKAQPISLNNLPFNAAYNRTPADVLAPGGSANECRSLGGQNAAVEGRPTSLISSASLGTLEFEAVFPNPSVKPGTRHDQQLTFKKDSKDFSQNQSMVLDGRDGRGIWEPKVASGYGYTVGASAGIPSVITVGPGDVVMPDISATNPFFIRLGICYTDKDGNHPSSASQFTIRRGYKSWGGGVLPRLIDMPLNRYWNQLNKRFNDEVCFDLNTAHTDDPSTRGNLAANGCPAHGFFRRVNNLSPCPAGDKDNDKDGNPICTFAPTPLQQVDSVADLVDTNTKLPKLDAFYYDSSTGMLFFNVVQEYPNVEAPSPLGSCKGSISDDPSCPNLEGESYYPCPAQGCFLYVVKLNGGDPGYQPGASTCAPYAGDKFTQPHPAPRFKLAYKLDASSPLVVTTEDPGIGGHSNYKPTQAPWSQGICPNE